MPDVGWLVYDDVRRDPSLHPVFDTLVEQINTGTARVRRLRGEYTRGFAVDGQKVLDTAALEYVLGRGPAAEFDDVAARAFTERMRALLGWDRISYTLQLWAEARLRDPYFDNVGSEYAPDWRLRADVDTSSLPESFFSFACYIAVNELKFGPSYASVSANRIFDWVTRLGSGLPARLKKRGTGDLPADLIELRAEGVTCRANDALATVRVTVTTESETAYAVVLDYLCRLLDDTDFPRSFALEFRGPTKGYLPIKGAPRRGVNQLFASAVAYPSLWPAIERYARAAMREHEWYTNLDDVDCAMPGTFAVLALGLADPAFEPLVVEYLALVDGEHQSVQGRFVEAYLDRDGFTTQGVAFLLACADNIQDLPHHKAYTASIAHRDALETLLAAKEDADAYAWALTLFVIWGKDAGRGGGQAVVDRAPEDLRELVAQILA